MKKIIGAVVVICSLLTAIVCKMYASKAYMNGYRDADKMN